MHKITSMQCLETVQGKDLFTHNLKLQNWANGFLISISIDSFIYDSFFIPLPGFLTQNIHITRN